MNEIYLHIARLAAPEIIVALTAFVVLAVDLIVTRDTEPDLRVTICSLFAVAGCAVSVAWMFGFPQDGSHAGADAALGMLEINRFTQLVKGSVLALTAITLLLSRTTRSNAASHVGERLALTLLSATGMMFLVSGRDLLLIFLSLELSTLPLYVLVAFDKHRRESAEAGLKFFLLGAVSTALTLFGFSIFYGLTGSTSLHTLVQTLANSDIDPLATGAVVLIIAGIGFKIAVAPFHMWVTDVYEAAPVSAATFIASASKVAGFFVLGTILVLGLGTATPGERTTGTAWLIALGVVAGFSMVLGNLAAIVQDNVRRLLAFSAVAHAGYMLLALLSPGADSFSALVFYAVTYGLSVLGALTITGHVQETNGASNLRDFAGLSRREPLLSMCMMVFMLSLAGIPPMAGFFGKFYVFATLMDPGPDSVWRLGLLLLAVGTSAVSLYYYLLVLKSIYVSAPESSRETPKVRLVAQLVLTAVALLVLALGCYPQALLGPLLGGTPGF